MTVLQLPRMIEASGVGQICTTGAVFQFRAKSQAVDIMADAIGDVFHQRH